MYSQDIYRIVRLGSPEFISLEMLNARNPFVSSVGAKSLRYDIL